MNFDFSDDQKALKDQARKFLSEKAGAKVTRVRKEGKTERVFKTKKTQGGKK